MLFPPPTLQAMLVFGGVTPSEDLSDVALWVPDLSPANAAPTRPPTISTRPNTVDKPITGASVADASALAKAGAGGYVLGEGLGTDSGGTSDQAVSDGPSLDIHQMRLGRMQS